MRGRPIDVTGRRAAEAVRVEALDGVEPPKEHRRNGRLHLQQGTRSRRGFEGLVGESAELRRVLEAVDRVAPTFMTVLIMGETGTGKELIARALHSRSARADRPFVKVSCGALSKGVVESELFGHEKGSFTGALARRTGRFELAHSGTIFLDEVGELSLETQVKLLDVLEDRAFEPVGSNETRVVDCRVIAATNRDLEGEVEAGTFRDDLYYRLSAFPIFVAPLRERAGDIPLLAEDFLARSQRRLGRTFQGLSERSMDLLSAYEWPGNVRELQNVIERAAVLASGSVVEIEDATLRGSSFRTVRAGRGDGLADASEALESVERVHILSVLKRTNGRVQGPGGAAGILQVNPSTLRSRMRKLGIQPRPMVAKSRGAS